VAERLKIRKYALARAPIFFVVSGYRKGGKEAPPKLRNRVTVERNLVFATGFLLPF
jgi:hypothetical protein